MKPLTTLPLNGSLADRTDASRLFAISTDLVSLRPEASGSVLESVPVICMDVTGPEGSRPALSGPEPIVWYQSVARLPISTTWVLTARVRVEVGEAGLWVRYMKSDGTGIPGVGEGILPVSKIGEEWTQLEYTFSLPAGTSSIEVGGAVASGSRALFTDFRLESGQEYPVRLRKEMVERMAEDGTSRPGRIQDAFLRVPRHLFLPGHALAAVYSDEAITTRYRQKKGKDMALSSSSQPGAMSMMIENLKLQPGDRVLEIGAGTGYNAAILAEITGPRNVFTIELEEAIARETRKNLTAAGYSEITLIQGDGWDGYPADAPYDRIIVTAGAPDLSPAWIDPLKEGGILVVPLSIPSVQLTLAFRKEGDRLVAESARFANFLTLRGRQNQEKIRTCGNLTVYHADAFTDAMLKAVDDMLEGSVVPLDLPPAHDGSLSSLIQFKYFLAFQEPMMLTFWHPCLRPFGIREDAHVQALVDLENQQVAIFGLNLAFGGSEIAGRMRDLVERWKTMGMPGLDRLDVRAYPRFSHPTVETVPRQAGDFLLEKPSNRFVIRYREA